MHHRTTLAVINEENGDRDTDSETESSTTPGAGAGAGAGTGTGTGTGTGAGAGAGAAKLKLKLKLKPKSMEGPPHHLCISVTTVHPITVQRAAPAVCHAMAILFQNPEEFVARILRLITLKAGGPLSPEEVPVVVTCMTQLHDLLWHLGLEALNSRMGPGPSITMSTDAEGFVTVGYSATPASGSGSASAPALHSALSTVAKTLGTYPCSGCWLSVLHTYACHTDVRDPSWVGISGVCAYSSALLTLVMPYPKFALESAHNPERCTRPAPPRPVPSHPIPPPPPPPPQ